MSEPTLNERERGPDAFASALGRLVPAASGLDRDRLMFLAGARARGLSKPGASRVWPIAAGLLALIVAGESALLARPRGSRVVVIHEPAAQPPPSTVATVENADPAVSEVGQNTGASAERSDPGLFGGFFKPGIALSHYRHLQDLALQLKLDADPEAAPYGPRPSSARTSLVPGAIPPISEELRRGDIEKFLPHGDFAWPPSFSL